MFKMDKLETLATETAQVTLRFLKLGLYDGKQGNRDLKKQVRDDVNYLRAIEEMDFLFKGSLTRIYFSVLRNRE